MREIFTNGKNLLFRKQTNILSAAFVIMATYGVSHLIGLLKTRLLISHFFGSSASLLDVYYAAFVIPDTVFQLLVVGALSAAFIPTFSKYLSRDEKSAWAMAAQAVNIIMVVLVLICVLLFVFAAPLSKLIAPGFSPQQIQTMILLMRTMLVAQVFFSLSGFLTSMIQTHHRFLIPALAPVVYNLGIIAGVIFLSPVLGIWGPAIGVVLGAVMHMGIQLPLALKLGFRFTPIISFKQAGVREIFRLMPPRALALGMDQIEHFAAVVLTSLLAAGSLSLLNAARLLYAIPASLFGMTIGQAAFPTLSQTASKDDLSEFKKVLLTAFLQVSYIALPVSTLFIVLRVPIVRIIFGASSFPWVATLLTGKTLAILAVSASFFAVMQLVVRGFYALHDTRTPLVVGVIAAIFNISFSILAVRYLGWGLLGIAGAISATSVLETGTLAWLLYRRVSTPSELKDLFKPLFKMIFISLVTGIGLWLPMRFLDQFVFDTTRTIWLIALTGITSIIGFSVYLSLSYWLKLDQVNDFVRLIMRVGEWRQILGKSPETLQVNTDSS